MTGTILRTVAALVLIASASIACSFWALEAGRIRSYGFLIIALNLAANLAVLVFAASRQRKLRTKASVKGGSAPTVPHWTI